MVAIGHTIRIFVSSTFADLHAERDALQQEVFPRLRTLCERQGARFQAIDLRWGVSQEASLDQQAMTICLEEIRRSQRLSPYVNFLALLGNRYGTRLPPEHILVDDFEALASVTLPADAALLQTWYRRDANAVPTEYRLLPRTGAFAEYKNWLVVRERLRAILVRACERAAVSSATQREILSSITEQEIEEGVFRAVQPSHALAFFRDLHGSLRGSQASLFVEQDADSADHLQRLKQRLREHLPQGVYTYDAHWGRVRPTAAHLPAFCDLVYQRLAENIQEALRQESAIAADEDDESVVHSHFGLERLETFVGRTDARAALRAYLDQPATAPMIITGPSGTGKTTLLAQASEDAHAATPQATILTRYIGISPTTSDVRSLFEELSHQLVRRAPGRFVGEIATDSDGIMRQFPEILALATAEHPVILILDALDQLRDERLSFAWAPRPLPPHVHIILSVLPDARLSALTEAFPGAPVLRVGGLTHDEGGAALDQWLTKAGRTLQPAQRDIILERFAAHGLPLFLRLACDEARHWPSWFAPPQPFPATIEAMLQAAFLRLESPASHGAVLVAHALGDLGGARYGLTEDEVLDLLSRDRRVMAEVRAHSVYTGRIQRLPFVMWARLYADLEPYLAERGADGFTVITFYHRQLSEAVAARYLQGKERIARHRALAQYYLAQPLLLSVGQPQIPNRRKLSELAFQQSQGSLHRALKRTLTDMDFLTRKIAYQKTAVLLADLALAGADPTITGVSAALRLGARILDRDERQLANQIVGRIGTVAALHNAQRDPDPHFVLESTTLTSPKTPAPSTWRGHKGSVHSCAFSPDGRRVVSASADFSLRIWDASAGQTLLALAGHTGSVNGCAFSPDGKLLASASDDQTVGLWDAISGKLLQMLAGHTSIVTACAFSPDGRLLASASEDQTVRLWQVDRRETIRALHGHTDAVLHCAFSPTGDTLASVSKDRTVRLWDVRRQMEPRVFTGHEAAVHHCAFSPDGHMIASASDDRTVRLWRTAGDETPLVLTGHDNFVHGCAFSPDGEQVLSAASDNTLRLWEVKTGQELAVVKGHETWVNDCGFSPDGARFVSACYDGSLRVWDSATRTMLVEMKSDMNYLRDCFVWPTRHHALDAARTGVRVWDTTQRRLLTTGQGHNGYVSGCAVSPDGSWALTSSADQTARVWSTTTWRSTQVLRGHTGIVYGCAISPNGAWALTASADKTLRLWNAQTWQLERELIGHKEQVRSCTFSPDSALALSASWDRTLRLWDIQSGETIRVFSGHADNVRGCAFGATGERILSASYDRTLRWWDVATGAVLQVLRGHTSWVFDCTLLAGQRALSAADDATLKLWSLDDGRPLATWYADAPLTCCDATLSGSVIVAGDSLGNLHMLHLQD